MSAVPGRPMPPPLVTIVVRSMGRECLADALASVALQRHRPLELVVVDATGGSHPSLPPIPGLDDVRLVSVGRRLNRPAAANVGLDAARGEWIGFLDDDDFLEPTHVDRLLAREGTRVRVLGGTVLLRHFAPATPQSGVELLVAGAEEASAFLRTLDAFVYRTSPTLVETAGRVVAEALACGVPVLCSRDVGFAELVSDGVDGFVVDPDDDAAMLDRIAALRADPARRQAMGRAARAKAEARFGHALQDRIRSVFLGG